MVRHMCQHVPVRSSRTRRILRGSRSRCSHLPTKYTCGCRNGFTPGAEFAKEGRGPLSCIEFDECVSTQDNGEPVHNCDSEHGICTNTVGSFTCSCEDGFTSDGKTCTEVPPSVSPPRVFHPCDSASAPLGSSLHPVLAENAKALTNARTTPRMTAMQTLTASNWMAASTVYACRASLEMVGLVQMKTSAATRSSSSVIQMQNVLTWLVPTNVSVSQVSKEMEKHASIWTNVRWVLIRVIRTQSALTPRATSRALVTLASWEME